MYNYNFQQKKVDDDNAIDTQTEIMQFIKFSLALGNLQLCCWRTFVLVVILARASVGFHSVTKGSEDGTGRH